MKLKHNKKRNTAFLYESLVKELTKAVVKKDTERKNVLVSMIKEHFSKGTVLNQELELYKALKGPCQKGRDPEIYYLGLFSPI